METWGYGDMGELNCVSQDPETMEELVRLMSLTLGESSPNKEKKYG